MSKSAAPAVGVVDIIGHSKRLGDADLVWAVSPGVVK